MIIDTPYRRIDSRFVSEVNCDEYDICYDGESRECYSITIKATAVDLKVSDRRVGDDLLYLDKSVRDEDWRKLLDALLAPYSEDVLVMRSTDL